MLLADQHLPQILGFFGCSQDFLNATAQLIQIIMRKLSVPINLELVCSTKRNLSVTYDTAEYSQRAPLTSFSSSVFYNTFSCDFEQFYCGLVMN